MRASTLWRQPRAWIVVLIGSLLAALSTLSYLGPTSDPDGHLRNLPLVLVTEDQGVTGPHGTVNLGGKLADAITAAARKDGRVHWSVVRTRQDAWRMLDAQDAYGALVVPRDFTGRALSLLGTGQHARRPMMELVEPRGVSGVAASTTDKVMRLTAAQASERIGAQLTAQAAAAARSKPGTPDTSGTSGTSRTPGTSGASGTPGTSGASGTSGNPGAPGTPGTSGASGISGTSGNAGASRTPGASGTSGTSGTHKAPPKAGAASAGLLALLGDPVGVTTTVRQPPSGDVGAAAGAFPLYIAIALLISGLLPATLLTTFVDARLGYVPLEIGPRRVVQPVIRITRSSTFLAKAVLGAAMGCVAGAVVACVALWTTGVRPGDTGQFVLFCSTACAAVSLLTLALFAVFGALGQLLALFSVTLVGVPLSAGAIPAEELPGGYDALGKALPARHVVEGVRSLLFFDGGGDRVHLAWLVLGAYAAGALLIGWAVCRWYDRRGYHRAQEHEFRPHRANEPAAAVP
ncbi:ABC transporter permease [Streptomyces sp. NPDC007971]|uniref:ABC transporter permease n=1 Tax=Streptomyces sp. NPDC007971 TaxID=3364799 RepID=UPI0036E4EAAA